MIGEIKLWAGSSTPLGWLVCDGQAVSRTQYADLFTIIGTTFGNGDGSTTFNVPDFRGRVPIGTGQGSGLTNRTNGDTGGTETETLTTAQLPAHSHSATVSVTTTVAVYNDEATTDEPEDNFLALPDDNSKIYHTTDDGGTLGGVSSSTSATIGNTGSGNAVNIMPPFGACNFIIEY